jgi:hypothetical protein
MTVLYSILSSEFLVSSQQTHCSPSTPSPSPYSLTPYNPIIVLLVSVISSPLHRVDFARATRIFKKSPISLVNSLLSPPYGKQKFTASAKGEQSSLLGNLHELYFLVGNNEKLSYSDGAGFLDP